MTIIGKEQTVITDNARIVLSEPDFDTACPSLSWAR